MTRPREKHPRPALPGASTAEARRAARIARMRRIADRQLADIARCIEESWRAGPPA